MNNIFTNVPRVRTGLFASAGIAALTLANPASAQDTNLADDLPTDCVDVDDDGVCDTVDTINSAPPVTQDNLIIVSGSRIARPNLDSPVPVTTVEVGELLNDGAISLGDALNDLPSLRSTFSTSNSQRFIGTTGLNFLDLRGLGTSRTLTLVNGRRHITSSAGDFQVDVNTIPLELLERVDVVTGGSSAVYGSDAIAGVVNFVLKRDYEGIELSGQGGISSRGDNGRYSISALVGKNFAEGRGNIAVVGEYSKIQRVFNSQRPENSGFGRGFRAFVQTDPSLDDEGITNSDGVADSSLVDGLFYDFISEGGTYSPFCLSDNTFQPLACDAEGNDVAFRFLQDGSLIREDNPNFRGSSFVQGGTGSTLSDGTLIPDIERYNINVLGHFDISDAFRPYAEFKYARIEALGQGGPSFFNGFCGGLAGAGGLDPSCFDGSTAPGFFVSFDNAFLDPAARDTLIALQDELLGQFGIGPGNSQGFTINRNNSDFGTRNDRIKRETYRAVAGIEGDISSNTRYDLSFTYGQYDSTSRFENNLIYQNARNAIDAVRDGSGQIVCRINADADQTNNDPSCVPLNIFGFGAPSQAALAYINTEAALFESAKQYDVLGFVSTDTGNFFELPGGAIGLVVGGEYRREEAFSEPDEFSATGATFFNAFSTFDPPALEVKEAFGEISVPILADMRFAEELTVSGAGRVSDYNSGAGNTGTVFSYNGSVVYSPVRDLTLRANYSRAVRSPTLSDLFSPLTQNFAFLTDPCDDDLIDQGTGTREANCRADGVPVGYDADQISGNRPILQGGSEGLEAETSDSYTIGGIFEPRFLPGFALSVDYYNIEVDKVIANVSANQILTNCYDAPDLDNGFCRQINPRQADGSFDPDAALILGPVNFAKLTAEGIDFDARYSRTFDNGDRLSLRALATYVIDRTNFLDVDNPELPNRVKSELGDPNWAANFNASYTTGPVTFSYGGRFIDRQFIGTYETYNPFINVCPADGLIPRTDGATCTAGELVEVPASNPDSTAEVVYPTRLYHDIRIDYRVDDGFLFYFGADNVTDEQPPFGLTGLGAGSSIYDNTGRYFYAGATVNF